jgi:hypothetical protein
MERVCFFGNIGRVPQSYLLLKLMGHIVSAGMPKIYSCSSAKIPEHIGGTFILATIQG